MAEAEDMPDPQGDAPSERPKRRRWGWPALRYVLAAVISLIAFALLAVLLLIWRLGESPMSLPQGVQQRIAAQIDRSMGENAVSLGDISLAMVDGSRRPRIQLSEVALRDEAGVRASFPEVSIMMDGAALLRRQLRPIEVVFDGAALTLSRDETGQLDLAFAEAAEASALGLEESLARIDEMFAGPFFERLERVEGQGLSINMQDAMTGQVIRASDGSLSLDRKGSVLTLSISGDITGTRDGRLAFAVTRNPETQNTDMRIQFDDMSARDVATSTPALAWLDLLRAPISGSLITRLADDGTLGDLSGHLGMGVGEITPNETIDPIPFEALDVYFEFDAEAARLSFTEFALASPVLSFTATGHADLVEAENSFIGQFQLQDIRANPFELYETELALDGGAADIRLSLEPNMRLDIGQAVIFKDDIELSASGYIEAMADGFALSIDANIPEAAPRDVLAYWPTRAVERTRRWVDENIIAGQASNIEFAIRRAPDRDPVEALRLDFAQTTARLTPNFPPLEDAAGYLSMIGPRLVVQVDEGVMPAPNGGNVDVAGSSFIVENARMRGPDAVVQLEIASQIPDLLTLLALPPTNLLRNSSRLDPATLASGRVEASGSLGLRLIRGQNPDDMRLDIEGTGFNLRSSEIVPDRLLTADRLAISVTSEQVAISGQAALDGVAISGNWSVPMGAGEPVASRAEGSAPLSPENLDALGITLPPGLVSGAGRAQFGLDIPPDGVAPALSLSSDLEGVGLSIPALGWASSRAATGQLQLDMTLGPNPSNADISLDVSGLELEGAIGLGEGGLFQRLDLERFVIGNWLNVQGGLVSRGQGQAPLIEVRSGRLDLRGLDPAPSAGSGQAGPLSVALDRLEVSRGIALTELRADLANNGGLSGNFQANVNGAVPITGRLVNTDTGTAILINAENGGAVLRAAGIMQNAYGGAMELALQPTGEAGVFDGTLSIENPRLRDAPVMAELLNLISVVGLLEQLGGQGINLGQVEGRFRLTPRAIQILEGSAIGPSMGISMDGLYDIEAGQIDMQGVVSPFYAINGLFGALFAPRREGLFGFSYRLSGPADALRVNVNPLSILTPGIFREIFRRPPPELAE